MKTKHAIILLALVLSATLFSCKSKQALTGKSNAKMSYKLLSKNLETNQFKYEWFQGKMKVNYADGKQKQSFTANLRMKKDEVIWISLTGFLGIEGGRVLITPDSIFVVDRLNKKYLKEPIDYAKQFLPIEADITTLQNIFIGNYLGETVNKQNLTINPSTYSYKTNIKGFPAHVEILASIFKYKTISIESAETNGIVNFNYEDYYEQENRQHFSMRRNISYEKEGKTYAINLNFAKIGINETLSFPFSINPKYAKMQF